MKIKIPFALLLYFLSVPIFSQVHSDSIKTTKNVEVSINWVGKDTVNLQIGKQESSFLPFEEHKFQLPLNERLMVQVKSPAKVYKADHYLTISKAKGNLYVEVKAGIVAMKYVGESKLKSCITSISENMVLIKGSTFQMGSINGGAAERPVHPVHLNGYYISRYEVTQEKWTAIMGSNPSNFKNCPNCPVDNVSWDDAIHFINRLNILTGGHYRLPTEAEWEYAANGASESATNVYSGSNTLNDVGWNYTNSGKKTHPVGMKMPNEMGLYDMTGNVWEWCQDWYGEKYYYTSPSDNPKGPVNGELHVLRGGSWFNFDLECRNSFRFYPLSDYRMYILGFRIVRDL